LSFLASTTSAAADKVWQPREIINYMLLLLLNRRNRTTAEPHESTFPIINFRLITRTEWRVTIEGEFPEMESIHQQLPETETSNREMLKCRSIANFLKLLLPLVDGNILVE